MAAFARISPLTLQIVAIRQPMELVDHLIQKWQVVFEKSWLPTKMNNVLIYFR